MRISTIFVTFLVLCLTILYTQVIPREGLIAYYKFDEGQGTVVADSSGNGLDGTIVGGPDWDEGIVGDGLYFNGVDSYVNCGDSAEFNIEFELTLMAWVYPFDLDDATHDPWISKGDNQYALKNGTGTYFEFFIYDDTWYAPQVAVTEDYNEEWHHYAGTYDGFELKMFIDGELMNTSAHEGVINTTDYEFWLGSNSQAAGRYFEGILDEVLVYDVALSEEEVTAVYDSYFGSTGVEEKPVGIAKDYTLAQNYPNPFNPSTMINYQLPLTSEVELSIHNLLGQKVATLVSERQSAGTYSVKWDASNFTSGVYLYRLQAGNYVATRKMMLIR
jgi:hypothetical protein